jgi:D-amino-acid dehydrogenase
MKVIVIGAGIVGLATAWWLARDGHAVTVVDRETEVGRGTSFANGGQLSYSYVAPMASPSVLRGLPKYLLSPSSPIRFVPRADPAQWRWAFAFLRACTADASALATAQLLALSFHSRDSLAEMMADAPLEFDHRRNGKLVVMSSAASMAEAEAQMRLQANFGCEQRALTAAECLALEPGLESIADRLVGGIHTPSEEVGDCRKLCGSLRAVLAAPPFAVSFSLGRRVRQLRRHGDRIAALETDAGEMEADLYVLCAGPASAGLARDARIRVHLGAGAGQQPRAGAQHHRQRAQDGVCPHRRRVARRGFRRVGKRRHDDPPRPDRLAGGRGVQSLSRRLRPR